MRISVYSHDANPAIDRRLHKISASQATEKIVKGEAFRLNQFSIKLLPPKCPLTREHPDIRTRNYSHVSGRMRASAVNEGRVGQFTIGYPIPFCFKGHLKEMRVSEVNA